MICGIGIDLVHIKRVRKMLNRWQERFIGRAFAPGEIEYCRDKAMPEIHYSARFAAKEAFLKSVGVGLGEGISLTDIEVGNEPHRPVLRLHGKAKHLMHMRGIKASHVSLSHTGDYATAVVVLEM